MQGFNTNFVGTLGKDVEVDHTNNRAKLNIAVQQPKVDGEKYTAWVSATAWGGKDGMGLDRLQNGKKGDRVVITRGQLTMSPKKDGGGDWYNLRCDAMDVDFIPKAAKQTDDIPF